MNLSTYEVMALEVLKGNLSAARALADRLVEDEALGVFLPPVNRITCHASKLRVAVYFPALIDGREFIVDADSMSGQIEDWLSPLHEPAPLMLVGAERIELYELP